MSGYTAPKKILVGTDFGPPSVAALEYAVTLAKALGASVHVVHGAELPFVGAPDGTLGISADVLGARIVEDAERWMNALVKKHEKDNPAVPLTASIEIGDPREGVLSAAEQQGADLIVLGTHGRHGLARALIGSIAEAVIRRSTRPVVTVHARLSDYESSIESQSPQQTSQSEQHSKNRQDYP